MSNTPHLTADIDEHWDRWRIARMVLYAVAALTNLAAFFFDGFVFDKLVIAVLFGSLIADEAGDHYRGLVDASSRRIVDLLRGWE